MSMVEVPLTWFPREYQKRLYDSYYQDLPYQAWMKANCIDDFRTYTVNCEPEFFDPRYHDENPDGDWDDHYLFVVVRFHFEARVDAMRFALRFT